MMHGPIYITFMTLYEVAAAHSPIDWSEWRQWRTEGSGFGGGGSTPPPRNSEGPPKSCQTQPDLKLLKTAEFRTPTPQDVRKKGNKILKLPPVRNCFTLAITNKLVVIINSFKVPKIKEILLYEIKFLVPNYSCLQNPWLGGFRPQIPVFSVLNWICWTPPPNKIPGYATGVNTARVARALGPVEYWPK